MLIYEMKYLVMQEHILTTLASWVYQIKTHFVFQFEKMIEILPYYSNVVLNRSSKT